MASFSGDIKLSAIPPFRIEKSIEYKVKAGEKVLVVTASSTFEAATKFAFWEKEVGLQVDVVEVDEVVDSETNQYVYNISRIDGNTKPTVELSHSVKESQIVSDTSTDASTNNEQTFAANTGLNLEGETLLTRRCSIILASRNFAHCKEKQYC